MQAAATTTYTLTATNEAGSSSATVTIGVDVTLAPPELSEFLADNKGILKDADGDSSDWIELKNPNPFRLGMAGYYLAGDPFNPLQWPFPAVRIPAHGFLIVFASGKDRRDPNAELHTNFRLDAKGDYLALVDSAGRILRQFPTSYPAVSKFPAQFKNVSYGVGSNGAVGFFHAIGVPLRQSYSSTETGIVAVDNGPPDDVRPDTVGRPVPGVEVSFGERPGESPLKKLLRRLRRREG